MGALPTYFIKSSVEPDSSALHQSIHRLADKAYRHAHWGHVYPFLLFLVIIFYCSSYRLGSPSDALFHIHSRHSYIYLTSIPSARALALLHCQRYSPVPPRIRSYRAMMPHSGMCWKGFARCSWQKGSLPTVQISVSCEKTKAGVRQHNHPVSFFHPTTLSRQRKVCVGA